MQHKKVGTWQCLYLEDGAMGETQVQLRAAHLRSVHFTASMLHLNHKSFLKDKKQTNINK